MLSWFFHDDLVPILSRFIQSFFAARPPKPLHIHEYLLAMQSAHGSDVALRVFIPTSGPLVRVAEELDREMQERLPGDLLIENVAEAKDADVELAIDNGKVVLRFLDALSIHLGLTRASWTFDPRSTPTVLLYIYHAAFFYYHLRNMPLRSVLWPEVKLELRKMAPEEKCSLGGTLRAENGTERQLDDRIPHRVPDKGPDLVDEAGISTTEVGPHYELIVVNKHLDVDVWVVLCHLDARGLRVREYFAGLPYNFDQY